ncbi:aminotransferase class V-fold PLP-dependent enzyme [Clostridium sp. Marseille-P3244]|uniref:aminotransferase class V-fold PLP-dependent enzyme n=1 Tax=Clostridium sp. Marseille-P3244 TaxID=1871020 RepID=UPI0009300463|nr:aminotransferase class V-fold PLP-dependent enzyme [Clostridium sp. Marseille-P3244]
MQTYPLKGMNLDEARAVQFRVIDCIMKEFEGHEILSRGDLGVVPGLNKPVATSKVERVIADIFEAESCVLVRGAGSGAIRLGLYSMIGPGEKILIHDAPVYSTTATSMEMMGLRCMKADYNDPDNLKAVLAKEKDIRGAVVQYTRQKPDDRYDMESVIRTIKEGADIPILTDDNYAVMKMKKTGVQCGADLSCFSSFKLLGPEGIGIVIGKEKYVRKIVDCSYSGGMQTQGHEALDVLRGLVYAPVSLAVEAEVIEECVDRLKKGEVPGIRDAFPANAQSKVLLVEFEEDIAEQVLEAAERLGAAPNPIGSESKYEMVPMFYRISGTFRRIDPTFEKRMIRINPMRGGADTVLRVLKRAMESVSICF